LFLQFTHPGVFKDKELLLYHRHLGEMSISPAYVERRAAEDWEDYQVRQWCWCMDTYIIVQCYSSVQLFHIKYKFC
jgi:hypothetical protein